MPIKNTTSTYGSVTKFLHWLIAFLVIIMLCIGYLLDDIKDKEVFRQAVNIHKLTGLTILILMMIRLIWALVNPKPALHKVPRWQLFAERFVHWSFYIVLIAMPLSGWIMSVAGKHSPHLFSWEINLPVPQSKFISDTFLNVHSTLAVIIIVLITIHVLAAFYHFFFKKDKVLQRMMPEL